MQNYSLLQIYLHHFILNNKIIKKSLFHLENLFLKNKNNIKDNKHIFISGMPRSGTTALLNFFYQSNKFASLTYNDMPFAIAPNFGSILPKKKLSKIERKHGDGIEIDNFSPEALDEIFFLTFNEDDQKEFFENYIGLILLRYSKNRYLSKNNSNYKRIDLISSTFKKSKIFILYRNPFDQACSLLEQHIKFCDIQKKDKFILDYMNYLGHYEFGLNYKTWNNPINYINHFFLDHWLEQWFFFYQKILRIKKNFENIIFISYDDLCENSLLIEKLCKISDLKYQNLPYFINKKKDRNFQYSEKMINQCNKLIEELDNSKFNLKNINL